VDCRIKSGDTGGEVRHTIAKMLMSLGIAPVSKGIPEKAGKGARALGVTNKASGGACQNPALHRFAGPNTMGALEG